MSVSVCACRCVCVYMYIQMGHSKQREHSRDARLPVSPERVNWGSNGLPRPPTHLSLEPQSRGALAGWRPDQIYI